MFGFKLPGELRELMRRRDVQRHPYYEAGADVYTLQGGGERLYLKVAQGGGLGREWRVLQWIGGRLPVPEPVWFVAEGGREFLVSGEVEGTPVYLVDEEGRGDAVVAMARALRMVHSLDPKGCPFSYPVEGKVTAIEEGLGVDDPDPSGLREGMPTEEPVFTHGDYCLPNVLVAEGRLGGVIDWDCGGLADRYVDFVSAVGSLGYNFGVGEAEEVWAPLFFEEYCVELDQERFRYYWKINELLD